MRQSKRIKEHVNNNFSYSYRVATIELSPHKGRQKHAFNGLMPSVPKNKIIGLNDPVTPKGDRVGGESVMAAPSPWEWQQASYSINKDCL